MNASDRGRKHLCPECDCKYYDLKRPVVACPKCGAKPPAPKTSKAAQPAKKTARLAFGRFP